MLTPVLRQFWPSVRRHLPSLTSLTLAMILIVVLEAAHPYFIRLFVNEFTQVEQSNVERIYQIFWMIIALAVANFFAHGMFEWSISHNETEVMNKLDKRSFTAIFRQAIRFFMNTFGGSLVKRAGRFSYAYEGMIDAFFFQIGKDILVLLVTFVIFVREYPLFAWVFLGWVVVFVVANVILAKWKYPLDTANAEADTKVGAALADAVTNYAAIKSFGMEDDEQERFNAVSEYRRRKRWAAWFAGNILMRVQHFTMAGLEILMIWFMIRGWERGAITVGDFVFFQSYILWIMGNFWGFGNNLRRIFQQAADAKEMVDIYNTIPEVLDKPNAQALQVTKGEITFDSVHFSYADSSEDNRKREVEHFSLHIPAGQSIALVGPSGAGKSTIINLLMRHFDIQKGVISIDGQNIADVTQQSLRQQMATVPQDPALFHRPLWKNIAFGRPKITREDVLFRELPDDLRLRIEQAAEQAHATEFIHELPKGFDTLVGERGVKLSVGQRQRIALARAFCKDAPLIVIDEGTSALDSETEKLIQNAIAELLLGRTSIVIAHRLSTIMQMDRILVLQKGIIIEDGSHKELLRNKNGLYARLWNHQSGGYME